MLLLESIETSYAPFDLFPAHTSTFVPITSYVHIKRSPVEEFSNAEFQGRLSIPTCPEDPCELRAPGQYNQTNFRILLEPPSCTVVNLHQLLQLRTKMFTTFTALTPRLHPEDCMLRTQDPLKSAFATRQSRARESREYTKAWMEEICTILQKEDQWVSHILNIYSP